MDLQTDYNLFNPYPSFKNTIGAEGEELETYEGKAKTQEAIVLSFFEKRRDRKFTSEGVWRILLELKLINNRVPKDSIKRSLSNLKNKGKLIKLDEMEIGEYGKPLHYYTITK